MSIGVIMKTERNILTAFILNLLFSLFELIGGLFTGSVAIVSDSVHDLGDAVSIGLSYFLERKSQKQPDNRYTYGYLRFSVLGGIITTLILLFGSLAVIYGAVSRLLNPISINYDGMIVLSIIGAIVNFAAAYFTREGNSINQKAVNLHMLEDMLGWVVVLIGSIVMLFTDIAIIDPLMSIAVAIFILINAVKNLKETLDIFLEKIPENIDIDEIRDHILEIDGVLDVHHIHIRTIDGHNNYATMHIVTNKEPSETKHRVREELKEHGITHSTLELEGENEHCHEQCCVIEHNHTHSHHHHH